MLLATARFSTSWETAGMASARFFQFKWKAKCRRREPVHRRLLTGESVQGCLFRGHREDTGSGIADWVLAASHAAWLGL